MHKSNHDTRAIPCAPMGTVQHNHSDANSIVGADICAYSIVGAIGLLYGKKPPTCLWASIVGARIHHTWYTWQGSSHTNSILQVPTSSLSEEANATSHVHLTFHSNVNSFVGAYHRLSSSAWATRNSNIRTLPLSPVKPSPSSIKWDALPPTKRSDSPEVNFLKSRLTRSIAHNPSSARLTT